MGRSRKGPGAQEMPSRSRAGYAQEMPSRSRAGHRGYNARRVGEFAADMLVALAWVALVVLILAFAGGGSNFIYIDF